MQLKRCDYQRWLSIGVQERPSIMKCSRCSISRMNINGRCIRLSLDLLVSARLMLRGRMLLTCVCGITALPLLLALFREIKEYKLARAAKKKLKVQKSQ